MKPTRIEELWREALQKLDGKPIEPNGFRLLRIDPNARFDIYAGVDGTPFVILAVGTRNRPPNIPFESGSLDYFRRQRHDGTWLMVLRLRRVGLEQVFGRLCQDLAEAASSVSDEKGLIALFKDRLELWRRLFQQGGDGLLQSHEIKGLLAELLELELLLTSSNRDVEEVVNAWTGSRRTDQDFMFSDMAVEVKAVGPDAEAVSISSLTQLDAEIPIRLVVRTLREAAQGEAHAVTLNAQVAKVEGLITERPAALSIFKARLLEACYVENDYYETTPFEPISRATYRVEPTFPRLTPQTVAPGVTSATYSLSLRSLERYLIPE